MKYSFALLLLFTAARAEAQDCCRVEGVVRAASGAPVVDADVTLIAPDAREPRVGKTDGSGHYVFDAVKPGTRIELRITSGGRPVASAYTLVTAFVETLDIKANPELTTPTVLADLDPMGGESGEVRGTVRAADGTPIGGAHVTIGATAVDVVTDSAGRYSFGRIRSKLTLALQVSANGFDGATREVSVPGSGTLDADFTVTPTGNTGNDTGLGLASASPDRAALSLAQPAVEAMPSLTPYDVFRAARFLPGASVGQDESEIYLHGSTPGETYLALDGMPWYSFPRLAAGLTTPLTTASIQNTDFSASPVDSEGGGRLADLAYMTTVGPRTRATGVAAVGVFGPSGTVSVPLGGIGSAMIAGRRSWPSSLYSDVLDRFAGPDTTYLRTRDVHYTGGTLAASPAIGFSSLNGRFEIAPASGNRGYVSFFHAGDDNNFSRDVLPPAAATGIGIPQPTELPADAVLQIGDVQSWTGRGVSAVWERRWSADVATTATVARSRFTSVRDQAYDLTSATAGDLSYATLRGGSEALTENNEVQDTTIRLTALLNVAFAHAIEAGVEHAAIDTSYTSRSEALSGLTPLLTRTSSGNLSSLFAQDAWRPTGRLTVTPGVRIVFDDLTSTSYVDPRATASYAPAPHVVLKASASIDHQAVNRLVREDLEHGDGVFWTLSDGTTVPVARSRQATLGITADMPGLLFDAHGYYRELDGLATFAPRLLPGTALTAPDAAFYTGTGTAYGVEFLVQHQLPRNTLWASYAGGRVEYSYPSLVTGSFPASFDRQHQLKLTDSARVAGPLRVTAAFLAGTGLPYTPATTAQQVWFASGALAYAPAFDAKNSARLPAYHQLDLSAQAAKRFGTVTTTVGVTVFNVYDRHNVAGYDYEAAGATAIVSQTALMRRAADIFFRVGF
jgi:hypothetical protein